MRFVVESQDVRTLNMLGSDAKPVSAGGWARFGNLTYRNWINIFQ
jgi:hypothetical protein